MERDKLGQVAVEVWRLGQRLEAAELSRDRLDDSLRRLTDALAEAGIRFGDPTGRPYTDGLNAEVVATNDTLPFGAPRTIQQVLRPAVYIDDVCVIAPQVVIGGPQQHPQQQDRRD